MQDKPVEDTAQDLVLQPVPPMTNETTEALAEVDENSTPFVVGIGASAGGLDPLHEFFRLAPADAGVAYVVVQHLSPDFESLMDELLRRCTNMPVSVAREAWEIRPNQVYLIPPRTDLALQDGHFHLLKSRPFHGAPVPIDFFLKSMAQSCGARCAAIILSGTGSDGSRGIQSVKEAGGLVLVQDPETAKFNGMPRAALATGSADFVAPVRDMPNRIASFFKDPEGVRVIAKMRADSGDEDAPLDTINNLLLRESGIDFRHYKPGTLMRRTCRRMAVHQISDLGAYVDYLHEHGEERGRLLKDYLIGVTEFFRDDEAFELLRRDVVPQLIGNADPTGLRIWVAGCSTGEEPYSLAMLIDEELRQRGSSLPFKVYATDVDATAVAQAGEGRFSHGIVARIGPERLDRYFTESADGYEVIRPLRERIVFAVHDIVKDPPFTRMNLVLCRNLLIYLKPQVQHHVLRNFHFSLKQGGYLMLGPSEVLPKDVGEEFGEVSLRWKVYNKLREVRLPITSGGLLSMGADSAPTLRDYRAGSAVPVSYNVQPYIQALEALVAERWEAALLLDANQRVLHGFGDVNRFCRQSPGKASLEVSRMLPDQARLIVVSALHRSQRRESAVHHGGVNFEFGEESFLADLDVLPLLQPKSNTGKFLVGFGERRLAAKEQERPEVDDSQRAYIDQLEDDLQQTKESLQATVEELEASNEELQSTNEELLASNEELQSTNEELHSVNEELYTVNAEHQIKIDELTSLSADVENMLKATEIGMVFIDEGLNIRKFTPAAAEHMALIEHDAGRPIHLFSNRFQGMDLNELCLTVVESGKDEVSVTRGAKGTPLQLRVFPYKKLGQGFEGLVITLVDITRITEAQEKLTASEERFRQIADRVEDVIWMTNAKGKAEYVSPAFERMWGVSIEEIMADPQEWLRHVHADDVERVRKEWAAQLGANEFDSEFRIVRPDGELRWVNYSARSILDKRGRTHKIVGITRDITRKKTWEQELQMQARELEEQAKIDALTGLANRRGLEDFLEVQLKALASAGVNLCVALVDLDDFKRVNDTLGHATGDIILQRLAEEMRMAVRPADFIARIGGDEFVIVFPETRLGEAGVVADRLRISLKEIHVEVGAENLGVSVSIGVALVPADAVTLEEILARTEGALSRGKRSGKDRVVVADNEDDGERDELEKFASSLASGTGLRMFSQSIRELSTGAEAGWELLVRGPEGAYASPLDLFRLCQEHDLLTVVDVQCLKLGIERSNRLNSVGRIHLNVFPSTLVNTPPRRIIELMEKAGGAHRFCVELSEQQFLGAPDYLRRTVRELKHAGVLVAIDDLGFGRSSLESLIVLEPEVVKIDRSFVRGAAGSGTRRRSLERLVRATEGLDTRVIAEGIEEEAERELLLRLGIQWGQGYLFDRPAEIE